MKRNEAETRRAFAHLRVHGLGASVEEREHGRGRPVMLLDERGQQVASVSPTAWKCGIREGMSRWEAEQQCPEVMAAEPDPEKYAYFRQRVMEVCGDYTPRLRELADESGTEILRSSASGGLPQNDIAQPVIALDLTGTERLFGPVKTIAQEIRNRLWVELGLVASVGVGPNAMVARLACESAKPGEVVEVEPKGAAEFVGELPVSALPGVDDDWAQRLDDMGIRLAKDLAALPEDAVRRALGEWGRMLWEIARGGDPQGGEPGGFSARGWERDSFSVQVELRPPTEERGRIRAGLRAVSEEIERKLRQRGQVTQQVKVTLVFRDMRKVAARRTLGRATRSGEVIFQAAVALCDRMKLGGRPVRRVRVTVGRLAAGPHGGQLGLPLEERTVRRERLSERVNQVWERYGDRALARGSTAELARF